MSQLFIVIDYKKVIKYDFKYLYLKEHPNFVSKILYLSFKHSFLNEKRSFGSNNAKKKVSNLNLNKICIPRQYLGLGYLF